MECVFNGARSNNMIQLITKGIDHDGCIDQKIHDQGKYIHLKLVGSIFQGIHNGATMQIQEKYTTLHKFGDANPKPFISNLEVQGLQQ